MLFAQLGVYKSLQFMVIIVIGITIHEFAHAVTAVKLGDDTPQRAGRVTLNPIKHIDPWGFISLIIIGVGWAKPVLIEPANLEQPDRDHVFISLAGPVSNFILAAAAVFLFKQFSETIFSYFLILAVVVNLMLFIINLIPVPPLDGFDILFSAFPKQYRETISELLINLSYSLLIIILIQNFTELEIIPFTTIIDFLFNLLLNNFPKLLA